MSRRPRLGLRKPLRGRIAAGHPWIYDGAISMAPGARAGDVVDIADAVGDVAVVYIDPESPIRARVIDEPGATIDAAWASKRAEAASAQRARDPLLEGCTGRRLVHGEADRCPGLVVDLYDDTAVIVFDGAGAAAFWRPLVGAVLDGLERGGHHIAHAWLRGDRRTRGANGEAIRGAPPHELAIDESGARFFVDVRAGQKTGFFLDQRDNRRAIRQHASGASVLNLFSYTGGFSIHAALGGARAVTSVDIAGPALATLARNVELTGLAPAAHELVTDDAFAFLGRAASAGRRWDLVIVDPPSFAPNERARPAALAAYRKLAVAALAVVEPRGRLAIASCSSHVTEVGLLEAISAPCLRLRMHAGAASDHPVLTAFPEGRYLKFLLFDVA